MTAEIWVGVIGVGLTPAAVTPNLHMGLAIHNLHMGLAIHNLHMGLAIHNRHMVTLNLHIIPNRHMAGMLINIVQEMFAQMAVTLLKAIYVDVVDVYILSRHIIPNRHMVHH